MTQIVRYPSIQIARAIAALSVLLVHGRSVPEYLGRASYNHGLWTFGQAGVDIFFAISGFIISAVVQRPQPLSQFVARRSLRILPFYWFFTLVWATVLLIWFQAPPSFSDLAASFAAVPQDKSPVLGVGWSLEHEFVFYAIVAVLLARGCADQLFNVMAALAVTSVTAHLVMPTAVEGGLSLHLLSLYHVEFFAGVALYRWRHKISNLPWAKLLFLGAMLFPLAAAILHMLYNSTVPAQPHGLLGVARVAMWGLASALMLGGLLACESQRPDIMAVAPGRALILIGGASYVLYLSHPIVFAFVGLGLKGIWPNGWPPIAAETIAIVVSLGFALLFYRWIEEPLVGRLSRLADVISSSRGRPWLASLSCKLDQSKS